MSIDEKDEKEKKQEENLGEEYAHKKKLEEEEEAKKKLEENAANKIVVSLGQSALSNPSMMNLLNKIDPKLTLQSLQNGLKNWDGKTMANHPLMQNSLVKHFAQTFANEMIKNDQKMGGKMSQGGLGAEVQQGMQQLSEFANSLPAPAPAKGPGAKFSKMLGNLSPTKAMVGSLAKTAASFAYQGAKMLDKMNQSQAMQQSPQSATPDAQKNTSVTSAVKTAGKMAGMLDKLSGGKANPASAVNTIASAVQGGPSKLGKMLKDSFMSGVKGGKK